MKIHTQDTKTIVLDAISQLDAFVSPTYGPAGRGVLMDSSVTDPVLLDDGFAIVEKFELEDEFRNAVIKFVREVTRKTNTRAGDGTTTSILIMTALVRKVFEENEQLLVKRDYNAIADELRKALTEATEQIRKRAKKIKTKTELQAIALNSYKNQDISNLIASLIYQTGTDGVITVEDSDSPETSAEVVRGFSFDRGYISPYLADNKKVVLKNPVIIVTDEEISNLAVIESIINAAIEDGRNEFLIVAHDVTGHALSNLIFNKAKGVIKVAAVKAPGFAQDRLELLEDLAVFVGGRANIARSGNKLSEAKLEHCGTAETVTVTEDMTIIIGGAGNQKVIDERVELLRPYTEKGSEYDRTRYKRRIASLSQGVGVIRVGAHTEAERATIKAKVDDAVHATQLAFRDGVVPGAAKTLMELETSSTLFNEALQYPREVLLKNGKNALSEDVYDAAGVLIAALESATSLASVLITLSGINTDKVEKDNKHACA